MAGLYNAIAEENRPQSRVIKIPKGFKSQDEFCQDMREKYSWGVGFNEHNVVAGKDDAKFTVGEQWDPQVRQKRIDARKPVLTFNRLVAFLAQIIGDRLMNETEIRVLPDQGGSKEIAKIREGIIRSIFKNSNAAFARDEAFKYQVIGGQGAYTMTAAYTNDDVFEQELRINPIYDPYAAVFDPLGIDPSGGDCQFTFVGEDIPHQEFKQRWPWASETSFEDHSTWNNSGFWIKEDTIRVVSYWRMVTEGHKTLVLYKDGTVHDVSDMEEYEYLPYAETYDDGSIYERTVPKRFARLYICSGNDILEGPYDYPCSSIPVYRVPGWEINDGEKIHRWGLIRFLKDPQRLHNYWRSTVAEQLVAAPRNKWLTTPDAVKGHQTKWRNAATSDDPFLYYNDGENPPTHIPPPGVDAALINEAGGTAQDMKDISNLHEAALGMPSNEVSGVALQQRNMISDVGTYIYKDRLNIADERCAKNANELIPHFYDTKRTLVVMGSDDKVQVAVINDPSIPNSDVTVGKYKTTVTVGPSSQTKRTLVAEQMMAFVNAAPEVAANVMDLVAGAQDWPDSDLFADRFKMLLPPGMIPDDELTPQMIQMQQKAQQSQEMQQQAQIAELQSKLAQQQAKTAEANSRAHLSMAQAYKAILDAHARQDDVDGKNQDRGLSALMQILGQHNDLEGEDREFNLKALLGLHGASIAQQQQDTSAAAQEAATQAPDNSDDGEQ